MKIASMNTFPLLLAAASLSVATASPSLSQELLWDTFFKAGQKAYGQKQYVEAERQFRSAAAACKTFEKKDDSRIQTTSKFMAKALQAQGKYAEAEQLLKKVMVSDIEEFGKRSTQAALDANELGLLYRQQNRCADARASFSQALEILEKNKKSQPLDLVATMNNLSLLCQDDGDYKESETWLNKALTLSEKSVGASSASTASCLENLARLYAVQGKFSEAKPLMERSLEIKEKSLGLGNISLANELSDLGKLYEQHGNSAEAEAYLKRGLSLRERELGKDHVDTAVSLLDLASFYLQEERYSEAIDFGQRAVLIREKSLGVKSPLLAEALNKLGLALMKADKYERAEASYKQAYEIDKQVSGEEGRACAQDLNNLGLLYLSQGKYELAESQYEKGLEIMKKVLPASHPDLATCMNNLAYCYANEDKCSEAEQLLKQGLEIREKALGGAHPALARNLSNLAHVYESQDKWSDSLPLLQRALTIATAALGDDHCDVESILRDLSCVYENLKDWGGMENTYRKLLVLDRKRSNNAENAGVAADLDGVARALLAQGKMQEAKPLLERAKYIKEKLPGGLSKFDPDADNTTEDKSFAGRPVKDKWAFVVGISNFKDSNLNLKYAAKDATDFANYLVKEAGFKPDHVKLLTDKDASRENIVSGLGDGWLKRLANSDDLVLIYISTHGSESKQQAGNANFIVPYDATFTNLVFNGIPMQWLTAGLKDLVHCERIVLILDACHGGAVDADAKGLERQQTIDMNKVNVGSGQIILASSQADQISWESKNYANGVFTRRLLEGLRSAGDKTKLNDAFKYMKERVEEEVLRDRAELQTPVLITKKWKGDDLVIAVPATEPRTGLLRKLP